MYSKNIITFGLKTKGSYIVRFSKRFGKNKVALFGRSINLKIHLFKFRKNYALFLKNEMK